MNRSTNSSGIIPSAYSGGEVAFWLPDQKPTSRVGYAGAPQTIDVMRKSAIRAQGNFATRRLAESICEHIDSKDYTSEYLALLYFLIQHTRYMRDPRTVELVRDPSVLSEQMMQGHRPSIDCDDGALWLASAILAIGGYACYETLAFSDMFYDGRRQYSHVLTTALEPRTRQKIVLDFVAAEKTPEMLRRCKAAKSWPIAA